jgi:hypothetical protein
MSVVLTSPFWERSWPWAAAVAVTSAWWWIGHPFPESPDALFGASATVASVFASFLGVSKALILTIKGTPTYQILEKKGYTSALFKYLRVGIFAAILFSSMSIVGFFVDHEATIADKKVYVVFSIAWVSSGALALFTYIRISNILFKLLRVS